MRCPPGEVGMKGSEPPSRHITSGPGATARPAGGIIPEIWSGEPQIAAPCTKPINFAGRLPDGGLSFPDLAFTRIANRDP